MKTTTWFAKLASLAGIFLVGLLLTAASPRGIIFEGPSLNGSIIVDESTNGMRTLLFERNGARQSVVKIGDPDHLELSYARTVLAGLPLGGKLNRILVIGLGGGSLPMFLHHNFSQAVIDVAEFDPAVIAVARKFFDVKEDDRLRLHLGDGRGFVEASVPAYYDVIIVDAYGANSVPPHLSTQEFVRLLRRAVAPEGVVIGNLWRKPFNAKYDSMLLTYDSVFDKTVVLNAASDANSIVLALPRKSAIKRGELAIMAGRLAKEKKFRMNLADIADSAFKEIDSLNLDGTIIRDRDLKPGSGQ